MFLFISADSTIKNIDKSTGGGGRPHIAKVGGKYPEKIHGLIKDKI